MARIQLALNVKDIDEGVAFYSKLFQTEPHKRRPGYANFEVADPPLKLILFEGDGAERLNHLGIEVDSPSDVTATVNRLSAQGIEPVADDGVCCFAEQTKAWVGPADDSWEIYAIVDDDPDGLGLDAADGPVSEPCCG